MSLTASLLDSKSFTSATSSNNTDQNVKKEIQSHLIPTIEENSLNILNRLVNSDKTLLEFEDNLKIFSLEGSDIGEFTIKVGPIIYKNQKCFRVSAKSVGTLDQMPCGTDITATINEHLETLEQNHYEYIKFPKHKLDRKTIIALRDDKEYVINKTEKSQNGTKNTTHIIKKALMNGFISESANILLQRLMTQNNIYEPFDLFTFDTDTNPCIVSYKPIDTRFIKVEEEELPVQGIERTVESVSDIPTTWQIYFSEDGHMINRVQVGYPAIMKSVIKPKPIEIDEYMPKIVIEKKELLIDNDMEMKSNYLDRKEDYKNEYNQYLREHPELKAIVADYMQSILCFKPDNVLEFTNKYFAPYSSKTNSNRLLPLLKQQINIPKQTY